MDMYKNKKLIIFDMDGTILNTLEDLADSTNTALTAHGFPQRTVEEVRHFVGNGIRKLIERAVPAGTPPEVTERVLADFQAHYAAHCADKTKPYDGVTELLAALKEKGYLTAVVSNKADFAVQSLCETYFAGLFDFAVGEREGIRRKPCPDSVFAALSHFRAAPEDAVYIGDSEVDLETAKCAGIDEISVEWGFRDRAFLEAHGADCFVKRPEEILRYL